MAPETTGNSLMPSCVTTNLGTPPVADTSYKALGPPEPNTIVFSSGLHAAPEMNPEGISQILVREPPSTGIRISDARDSKVAPNPTTLLLGDQNGLVPPSLPWTAFGCSWSRCWTHNRSELSEWVKTMRFPSGETAAERLIEFGVATGVRSTNRRKGIWDSVRGWRNNHAPVPASPRPPATSKRIVSPRMPRGPASA